MMTHRARASRLQLAPAGARSSSLAPLLAFMLIACGEGSVTRNAEVSNISITPPNATMVVGGTLTLAAQVDASAPAAPELFWSSSDETVATVTSGGVVKALKAGRANIAATALGNSAVSSIVVSTPPVIPPVIPPVLPQSVSTISVSLSAGSIGVGKTTQATAVLKSANGTTLNGRTITWSSSASNIATVSGSGLVTAKKQGVVTIHATSEGKQGSTALTVTK